MGNTPQSTQTGETIQVTISHPKFTNTKLIKSPNEVFIQSIIMCEQKQFVKFQKQILPLQKQNTDHLFLPKNIKFVSTHLCGSSGHLQLLYPYYPYLLSQQVYNRNGKHLKFEETDLWYLLYCISAGKEELTKSGFSKGLQQTVDMNSIFLNDQGRVKVACRQSWPGSMSVWQRALQKEPVYISNECFSRIAKGEMQPQDQQSSKLMQSESQFSIGLTLLNSALLINQSTSQPLIDYKEMTYNYSQLNRRINEFVIVRGFSDILKAIILNLLSQFAEQRLTHEELWSLIKDHSEEIQSRKNFLINNATNKVHKAVQNFRALKVKLQNVSQAPLVLPLSGQLYVQQPKSFSNKIENLQTSTVIKHEVVSTGILKSTDKIVSSKQIQKQSTQKNIDSAQQQQNQNEQKSNKNIQSSQ